MGTGRADADCEQVESADGHGFNGYLTQRFDYYIRGLVAVIDRYFLDIKGNEIARSNSAQLLDRHVVINQ